MSAGYATAIGAIEDSAQRFFAYARERHSVYLRRAQGLPAPWTDDPVLQHYRFTNVFRELDAVTVWFAKHVRERYDGAPECLLATVLFRWFNRITTGETLFCQPDLMAKRTPFEVFLDGSRSRSLHDRLEYMRSALVKQGPPYVTGSYTVNSPGGMNKLDGVLHMFGAFASERDWHARGQQLLVPRFGHTMEGTWRWLMDGTVGMGPFMAYEVVCDLRYTELLEYAADVNSWASAGGPGARRGAARILGKGTTTTPRGERPAFASEKETTRVMECLLATSRDNRWWPQRQEFSACVPDGLDGRFMRWQGEELIDADLRRLELDPARGGSAWPAWEMREVEHTLCEFDKYERTRLGQGRPRGVL